MRASVGVAQRVSVLTQTQANAQNQIIIPAAGAGRVISLLAFRYSIYGTGTPPNVSTPVFGAVLDGATQVSGFAAQAIGPETDNVSLQPYTLVGSPNTAMTVQLAAAGANNTTIINAFYATGAPKTGDFQGVFNSGTHAAVTVTTPAAPAGMRVMVTDNRVSVYGSGTMPTGVSPLIYTIADSSLGTLMQGTISAAASAVTPLGAVNITGGIVSSPGGSISCTIPDGGANVSVYNALYYQFVNA